MSRDHNATESSGDSFDCPTPGCDYSGPASPQTDARGKGYTQCPTCQKAYLHIDRCPECGETLDLDSLGALAKGVMKLAFLGVRKAVSRQRCVAPAFFKCPKCGFSSSVQADFHSLGDEYSPVRGSDVVDLPFRGELLTSDSEEGDR